MLTIPLVAPSPFCPSDNWTCIVTYLWSHLSNLPNCWPMIASLLETYQVQWSSIRPVSQYRSLVYKLAAYQVLLSRIGWGSSNAAFFSVSRIWCNLMPVVHCSVSHRIWFCSKTTSLWIKDHAMPETRFKFSLLHLMPVYTLYYWCCFFLYKMICCKEYKRRCC